MNKKHILLFIACILVLVGVYNYPNTITLHLGVFAGSNWDVPSSGTSYKVIDGAIKRFEKNNPGIKVKYESGISKGDYSFWLSDKIVEGKEPDVFMILNDDFNTLSSIGALTNITGYMKHDENFKQSDYYETVLKSGIYNAKQYALPYECDPTLMFVNKTLLSQLNIQLPDNNWTLDNFYNLCKRVSSSRYYAYYDYSWEDALYAYGASLFDEKGEKCNLDQRSVKEAILYTQKLKELNKNHDVTQEEFDKGQVAFAPMSLSVYRTYKPYPWRIKKYSTFEWDCLKMPSVKGNALGTQVSTLLMGMSAKSKHKPQAWTLLKELCYSEKTQLSLTQYSQGISPLKKVARSKTILEMLDEEAGDSKVSLSLLNQALLEARNRSKFKKYDSAMNLLDTRMNQIINSDSDVDLSLIQLQKDINKFLNE